MLSHLEFEQVKRALERLRTEGSSGSYGATAIRRDDVIEILMPYVDGFTPPNPHPVPPPAPDAKAT